MVAGRIGAIGTPADLKQQSGVDSIDELFVRLARPDAPAATGQARLAHAAGEGGPAGDRA